MSEPTLAETTDSWSTGKILKHIILPKPKGSPKAGKREKRLRLLFFAVGLVAAYLIFSPGSATLPACDRPEVLTTTRGVIEKLVNQPIVSFVNVSEVGLDRSTETRMCKGQLFLRSGEQQVTYAVRWTDRDKQRFAVSVEIK